MAETTTILISMGHYRAIQQLAEKQRRSAAAQLAVILEDAGIEELDDSK